MVSSYPTQFCPKCGFENDGKVNRCSRCGGLMEESAGGPDRGSTAPLHLKWAGIAFIVLAVLIAITSLTGLKKHFFWCENAESLMHADFALKNSESAKSSTGFTLWALV